jgi:hypothetical protein
MKCQSGQHEWVSPVNARRCCNPLWQRIRVPESEAKTLDVNGRIFEEDTLMVSGWVEAETTPRDLREVLVYLQSGL